MNPPNIKKLLLVIGILPTLLASIIQIGYLSIRQNSEYTHPSQPAALAPNSINSVTSIPNQPATSQPTFRSLILATSLIGLSSILLASFMAIYFGRRINPSPLNKAKVEPKHNGTSEASLARSETAEANSTPLNRLATNSLSFQKAASEPTQFSVLIADDNNINRLLLTNQLEDRCQKITVAKEGIEALQHLTAERFDLIFLDLQMPGHNGLELIKMIRKDHCINRDTPVIAITAHAQLCHRQTFIAEGFDECLIKPVLTEQLDEIFDLWQHPSSATNPVAPPAYHQQILNKTCQNYDLALTIATKLFEELPRQLAQIETALKNQHPGLALEITHKLHGSVSFCGLTDIQKPAYALEQSLLNNDHANANIHFHKLQDIAQKFFASELVTLAALSKRA